MNHNQADTSTITSRRARGPNLSELDRSQLINYVASAFERCAERLRLLAKLAHGKESSRWSRMARSVESAASALRVGSCCYEKLRAPAKEMVQ